MVGFALLAALGRAPAASPSPSGTPDEVGAFRAFVQDLRPEALGQGIPAALFDDTLGPLAPDPSVAAMTRRQPEFTQPIGAYLAAQVTEGRVAQGRAALRRWATDLAAIERRYGVPAALVVAVWGLETNYGAAGGTKDVIRSMATLASINYRPALYRGELIAALASLADGSARRQDLRGSWAGAMGQPQFMPSSFRAYAVDGDGDGRRDIWASVPDALASIANFLQAKGWDAGQPWGAEITLPPGFDMRTSRAGFEAWTALGVTRADGLPLPRNGNGILFYPAGARGPTFLVTANFEVIKTYNFSDAYVLSVAQLADRMTGGAPIRAAWPNDRPMAKDQRIALQTRLAERGYVVDNREGRISLALRDEIRRAQRAVGLPPDGNPTDALLAAIQ